MTAKYKTVYKYDDPETGTGEFLNSVKAQENPKLPGTYFIIPNTTETEPKPCNTNQTNRINAARTDWDLVPDYRGHEYYLPDGSHHKIETINTEPPEDALDEPPPPSVEIVGNQKRAEINNKADAILQPITSNYPNSEMLSWDKQEIEARRWQTWNNSDQTEPEPLTPLIDQILVTRTDITKPDLIVMIIEKADAYAATGQIFGIRHNLEADLDAILADDTLTDDQKRTAINAINVDLAYNLAAI